MAFVMDTVLSEKTVSAGRAEELLESAEENLDSRLGRNTWEYRFELSGENGEVVYEVSPNSLGGKLMSNIPLSRYAARFLDSETIAQGTVPDDQIIEGHEEERRGLYWRREI